jgi:hypothetical protein
MTGTPITITIYDAHDEPKPYSRTVIPWGVLKKAIALTKTIEKEHVTEQDMDAIAGLIVDAFGNQFAIEDLDKGADIGDMLAVLQSIVARASALVQANPTLPVPSRKKHLK